MKRNNIAPIEKFILNFNGKDINLPIPKVTYSLSPRELIYIKTLKSTQRKEFPNLTSINTTLAFFIKNKLVVLEVKNDKTYMYVQDNIKWIASKTQYMIGRFFTKKKEKDFLILRLNVENNIEIDKNDNTQLYEIFDSLDSLKVESKVYNNLSEEEQKRVLDNVEDVNLITKKRENQEISLNLAEHLIVGHLNDKFSGVHHISFINQNWVRVVDIEAYPNEQGIWSGNIEYISKTFTKKKKDTTTFFPTEWGTIKLFDEINFALENKIKQKQMEKQIKWTSKTRCGINVIIYTDLNGNYNTIYPLY